MTRMTIEGHTAYVIYLHFAKAFDSFGLADVAVRWIETPYWARLKNTR